jgi:hypothetical protein
MDKHQDIINLIKSAPAIAAMKAGFHSGMDRYPSRDELHER